MREQERTAPRAWRGMDLAGTDWSGRDLTAADLRGARLTAAILTGACLRDANLRGADLCGADLAAADLNGADLVGVRYDATTRWPEGFDPAVRIMVRAPLSGGRPPSPEDRVLASFFDGERLVRLPLHSDRKKIVVLRRLVRRFALGARYTEREVNALLRSAHDDVASLRRMLVDYRFLARTNGIYWRTWVEAADFRTPELESAESESADRA